MIIRRADPADAGRLAALMGECFVLAYQHASDPPRIAEYVRTQFAADVIAGQLDDRQLLTWIVEDLAGHWRGFGQLHLRIDPPVCVSDARHPLELRRFYFHPAVHGSGMAAALMAELKHTARAHGADALWLCAWQQALQAIRFYEKHGFASVGTATFWVMDDPKDDWVMRCHLQGGRRRP